MRYRTTIFFLICLSFLNSTAQISRPYQRLKVGIHFDSIVSGGNYTMGELAGIANTYGLDVAIITDHDNMKVSYGIQPFQKFLKLSIKENSISTYSVEKYLQEIDQINKIFPNIIFIPGVEAVPYYFWEGSPMYNNLKLRNWHTHFLVFGLNTVDAFKNIPSLANGGLGYKKPGKDLMKYISENFMYFSMIALYIIIFLISFFNIIKRSRRRYDIAHITRHKRKKYRFSKGAFLSALIFGYVLYAEFPFLPDKYDQYHGNQSPGPYQELINYVNRKGGLIYFAHPEVSNSLVRPVKIPFLSQSINIKTDAYPQLITETKNYTGFAIFWEGMKTIGRPGGLWDIALDEYCRGYRSKPVYSIGELDYEGENDLNEVAATNTFIFAKARTREAVYEAFRSGRSYATRDFMGNKVLLDDFSVYDRLTRANAFIGETLNLSGKTAAIHVKMHSIVGNISPVSVYLYKEDKLVKRWQMSNSIDEWFIDNVLQSDKMTYYRIYAGNRNYYTLVTNPIFIRTK
ncbi:MAG: hypothetical protein J7L22_00675 [Candidatus Marinimicrobia bacterium]|nr:hypothetical protein [Candidatus Neomarinimicrobiota bacterium]